MREFFMDFALPMLVCGALGGSLLYVWFGFVVHDYLKQNYSDALPPRMKLLWHDTEVMGDFVNGLWYAQKHGGWKRIESNTWRRFFIVTQLLGAATFISCLLLFSAFIFWPHLS